MSDPAPPDEREGADGTTGDADATAGGPDEAVETGPVATDGGTAAGATEESDLARLDRMLRSRFSPYPIVKKEFYDTVRSRTLLVLSTVFVGLFVLSPALALYTQLGQQIQQEEGVTVTTNAFIPPALGRIASVLVPIIAIAVTYAAIAGERERGSLKLLLSLPYTRGEVVAGKVAGRGAVVGIPLVASLLISALVFVPSAIAVKPVGYLVFAALTGLLALAFVALSVGISAWARSTRAAMFGTVGLFVYFFALWNPSANGLGNLLSNYTDTGSAMIVKVQLAFKLLNPTQAYQSLLTAWVSGESTAVARASMFGGLFSGRGGLIRRQFVAQQLEGSVPVYLSDGAALVALVLWLVVPLALGYRAFERGDL
jgi:ABC-2 type transport system permease protein